MLLDLISSTIPSSEPSSTPQNKSEAHSRSSDTGHFDPEIRRFLDASIAASTRRAYDGDVAHFVAWGGSIPAPSETIARYLADHAATLSMATLCRRLAAIGRAHVLEGLANPATTDLVRMVRRGIRRLYGRPQERVSALTKEHLVAIVSSLGNSTRDVRDRALLSIGFAGAFRRSELIAIDFNSIKRNPQGIVIRVCKSKTDQESRGRDIAIPYSAGPACPVQALDVWLDLAKITEGPVFRPVP